MDARIATDQAPTGQAEARGAGDQDDTAPLGEPGARGGTPPPGRPTGKHLSIGLWASLWDPEAHRRALPACQRAQAGAGAEGRTAAPASAVVGVVADPHPPRDSAAPRRPDQGTPDGV